MIQTELFIWPPRARSASPLAVRNHMIAKGMTSRKDLVVNQLGTNPSIPLDLSQLSRSPFASRTITPRKSSITPRSRCSESVNYQRSSSVPRTRPPIQDWQVFNSFLFFLYYRHSSNVTKNQTRYYHFFFFLSNSLFSLYLNWLKM